ncbi:alkaline phosphatase [Fulvivirga sp. M361]|uniref:alkaline phosphatase D family protein n=1 Tax=Fulvivirga sp. M361 TaxID=2594266 RepID=UPI001179CFA2|nr:alkaline phosphatase D family protein [Fulvivirga sp. M361]TRX46390.1 alkaline phosphatase [Fulvivirga sp. M361]
MKKQYLDALSRRKFIRNSVVAATGTTLLPTVLAGCNDDDDGFNPVGEFGFFEGVASFDPTQNNVILWTRYTPASNEEDQPTILLDVATDKDFSTIVASESVVIDQQSDNTVNVDLSNLTSNTIYYYRFRNDRSGARSVTGQTKTLPAAGQSSEVRLAVVSCANFQAGLFNVYGAVAESDADVVVHLGDYIYEYEVGGYGTNELTAPLNREHSPAGEIITVDDYRGRYRQYRRDVQLQKAHQLKPFICVWDDHEITNDAFKDGAENHQPNEGDYETRKMSAIQVWHEYLPARVTDNAKIYRNFEIAGLVNLIMLDTRIAGREKQLNYSNYLTPSGLGSSFFTDWQDTNRTILGTEQRNWLTSQLASNNLTWQVLGSQVLMAKYYIPAELLTITAQIAIGGVTPELLNTYNTTVTELVTIKTRIAQGDPTVTDMERARVNTVLPYNLDAWDGYPVERETILASAKGKKLVSIAGDTHNAWHAKLSDASQNDVGKEFATASVSSPGFEGIFGTDLAVIGGFEQANIALIDDLIYLDASHRGYLQVTFSQSSTSAEWRFIETLAVENTNTVVGKSITETS